MSLGYPDALDVGKIGRTVNRVEAGIAYLATVLKWVLVLNLGIGWIAFWASLVRLHLSMGDAVGAVLTIALVIVPVTVGLAWWIGQKLGLFHIGYSDHNR